MNYESVAQFEGLCRGFNEHFLSPRELITFSENILGIPCLGDSSIPYGIAYIERRRSFIFYNSTLSRIQKSIVLAHEIGHHWLTHWNTAGVCQFTRSALFSRTGIESEASVFSLIAILPNAVLESLLCDSFAEPSAMVDMLCVHCREEFDVARAGEAINEETIREICTARVRVYMSLLRRLGRLSIHT